MKDNEQRDQFMENWAQKRQKGKYMYVLIRAGQAAISGLAGVLAASLFLYNSPSEYSFSFYLPTYLFIFFGVFLAAALVYKIQWLKNEKKYIQ